MHIKIEDVEDKSRNGPCVSVREGGQRARCLRQEKKCCRLEAHQLILTPPYTLIRGFSHNMSAKFGCF